MVSFMLFCWYLNATEPENVDGVNAVDSVAEAIRLAPPLSPARLTGWCLLCDGGGRRRCKRFVARLKPRCVCVCGRASEPSGLSCVCACVCLCLCAEKVEIYSEWMEQLTHRQTQRAKLARDAHIHNGNRQRSLEIGALFVLDAQKALLFLSLSFALSLIQPILPPTLPSAILSLKALYYPPSIRPTAHQFNQQVGT